ncbi:N-acyl-D-amino-acid deacylase family protein [Terrilactibacillus laevilacticus]|uniref:Amidohydrolase family protein n=1 Tax=Terrilactibacillus laevilacticus TaxID=1380157 RepID=A0ABW5PML8_9BACI|nr:D-aminoacylase [Terrilactibacillus laevilacticus]
MLELIIKNGFVFDGTGNPWTKTDVGVKDGRIQAIGDLKNIEAEAVYDATGLAVAPGFIDSHVHSDLNCTIPEVHKIKAMQGVTLEVFGQDGLSVAPVSNQTKPLWQKQLNGLDGDIGEWPWETIDEYFDFLRESKMIGNAVYLVPHGAIRTLVMGFDGRVPTKVEMERMRELVEEGMRQGAVGLSTGLVYPPNVYSNKEELIEICRGAAKYDGCFVVHIRNESMHDLEALDEVIDVARKSGVRLHISHFKVIGQRNREKFPLALKKMELARNEGIEVTFDQYPYTAASTVFQAILPPWMHDGGTLEMLERLKSPEMRKRIINDIETNTDYENWIFNCGMENIIIASVKSKENKILEGKNMLEVSKIRNQNPYEAAFDLLLEEQGAVTMVIHWGVEEDLLLGLCHPFQVVGSDGVFGGKPHPRLYGTFPRVLSEYVRKKKVLPLEKAIHQMTGAPAQIVRLKDRGLLKENYWADIVVFDPDTVEDQATYEHPLELPKGIFDVLINGKWVVKDGQYTGELPGQIITREEEGINITEKI